MQARIGLTPERARRGSRILEAFVAGHRVAGGGFHPVFPESPLHVDSHAAGTPAGNDASREHDVDKNRIEGAKNQAKGSLKEAAGKVTGNTSGELEGKLQKNVGKVQKAVGKASDDVRSDARKTRD